MNYEKLGRPEIIRMQEVRTKLFLLPDSFCVELLVFKKDAVRLIQVYENLKFHTWLGNGATLPEGT